MDTPHPATIPGLTPFQSHVAAVVRALGVGELLTYAEVAREAGHDGAARGVASVLRRASDLPWWRVVPADGRLHGGHAPEQARLLRSEGLVVDDRSRIRGVRSATVASGRTVSRRAAGE